MQRNVAGSTRCDAGDDFSVVGPPHKCVAKPCRIGQGDSLVNRIRNRIDRNIRRVKRDGILDHFPLCVKRPVSGTACRNCCYLRSASLRGIPALEEIAVYQQILQHQSVLRGIYRGIGVFNTERLQVLVVVCYIVCDGVFVFLQFSNYFLCNQNQIAHRAVLAFGKTFLFISRSYCGINNDRVAFRLRNRVRAGNFFTCRIVQEIPSAKAALPICNITRLCAGCRVAKFCFQLMGTWFSSRQKLNAVAVGVVLAAIYIVLAQDQDIQHSDLAVCIDVTGFCLNVDRIAIGIIYTSVYIVLTQCQHIQHIDCTVAVYIAGYIVDDSDQTGNQIDVYRISLVV